MFLRRKQIKNLPTIINIHIDIDIRQNNRHHISSFSGIFYTELIKIARQKMILLPEY